MKRFLLLLFCAVSLSAATLTPNRVPVATGAAVIGDSPITITGNDAGVDGKFNPTDKIGTVDALAVAEADVASATTTDLGAATTEHVRITGTVTITGFGTVASGVKRWGRFSGALTLTHNGTSLILPGAANITTVANDRFIAISLGSGNWLVYNYMRATWTGSGSAVFATSPTLTTPTIADLSNSTHTHQNNAGGGTLTFAALPTRTIATGAGTSGGGDLSGDRTIIWAPDTFVNNITLWDSSQASRTLTFGLSGATDPVFTIGNNSVDLTTGVLKYAGNTVAIAARALTIAGTANEITSSAGSQDLTADRTWTLSLPSALTFTGKTVTGGTFSGPTVASVMTLGVAGSAVGSLDFKNATSGTLTLLPPTGALGTFNVTLPNAASTLPIFGQQITFAGPTAARTITLPDAAFTVARSDAANTFTGTQTITQIDVGNADTSITRASAGDIAVEGNIVYRAGGTKVPITDGGTGQGTANAALDALITAEADVASATTTDLGAQTTQNLRITGTTTITGFGTVAAGTRRWVRFSGALTLTHNATSLILPGGANITTVAGDSLITLSLGSGNWKVLGYWPATWTGTGSEVHATSPSFTTPTLGVASATTVNKWTFTAPTTAATLTAGADNLTYTGPAASDTLVGRSSTDTLANKRVSARITTITSNATPTVNSDNADCVTITALAAAITSMTTNLSGTPNNFDQLEFRIKDDGTARAITWGASFAAGPVALPTTTVVSKALHVYFEYDTVRAVWVCMSTGSDA